MKMQSAPPPQGGGAFLCGTGIFFILNKRVSVLVILLLTGKAKFRQKGANMYYNKVEICGVNTSQLAVLSDTQKRELLLKCKQGDGEARKTLICGNLRLVLSIIQRFINRRENMDDLFQVGCIWLVKAVDNFNTELDVKFSTYAVPMIIGEIRRYLRDNNTIRISRSMRDLAYRTLQAREEWIREKEVEPDIDQLATQLGEPREAVLRAMEAIVEPISLYEPVFTENGDSVYVMDQLRDSSSDSSDEAWLENILLRDAMQTLNDRERNILVKRFYHNKTQMEIADEIGISQAQVSRLEKGALEHLRSHM
jgi:RNA polymerase sporulation-specific sigma factor